MVASNKRYPVWIPDFEAEEKEEGFERVEAAVNEVAWSWSALRPLRGAVIHTHEQVVCVGYISANTEQLHEIMKLAVNIAAYLLSRDQLCPWHMFQGPYRHRRIDAHDVALLYQQLTCLVAELSDLVFGDRTTCAELLNGSASVVSTITLRTRRKAG